MAAVIAIPPANQVSAGSSGSAPSVLAHSTEPSSTSATDRALPEIAATRAPAAASVQPEPHRISRAKNGEYEVSIVQSSGMIPGTASLLTGRPVHTVYLSVDEPKAWVLQYCLRAKQQESKPAQVVEIGSPPQVAAPWAYLMFRPDVQFRSPTRYGFVHGFITEAGKLEQIVEAGEPAITNLEAVLETLSRWEFRPALNDGVSVAVEILLCIPNLNR